MHVPVTKWIPQGRLPDTAYRIRGYPMYSLAQAAKAAGKSKPTLLRAIRSGRLSATRHDDVTYAIDPAELIRAFSPVSGAVPDSMKQSVSHNGGGYEPG